MFTSRGSSSSSVIVGGFYSQVALPKREAEGTVHTEHQLNVDPSPEGTQRNLDARRGSGAGGAISGRPHDKQTKQAGVELFGRVLFFGTPRRFGTILFTTVAVSVQTLCFFVFAKSTPLTRSEFSPQDPTPPSPPCFQFVCHGGALRDGDWNRHRRLTWWPGRAARPTRWGVRGGDARTTPGADFLC